MGRSVVVVGAGISKLVATKCLEEGLEPTCFGQSRGIMGLWCYTEGSSKIPWKVWHYFLVFIMENLKPEFHHQGEKSKPLKILICLFGLVRF
uniref:Flavin-containing monooxygenase n=1 Tax=Amazona collaria TaxID=241587 RepID=A0A8B9FND0_9PSIT